MIRSAPESDPETPLARDEAGRAPPDAPRPPWSFGDLVLDPARRELRRCGSPVHLEPKVLDLLVYLVRHRERVVSRDEIFHALWSDAHVSDAALGYCVRSARKAVGDSGDTQHTIATVPRRGLRFVAAISGAIVLAESKRVAPHASFVGRDAILALLVDALAESRRGELRVALITGEPGIGKTRLAEELSAVAEASGVDVLTGRCHEDVGAPPFWPWTQILRRYAARGDRAGAWTALARDELAALVPEIQPASRRLAPPVAPSTDQRFQLFDAVRGVLERAATHRPLLLVLDDLQWSDAPSLLLLRFLAREVPRVPLMLVAVYRDTDVAPEHPVAACAADLVRVARTEFVQLTGLTERDLGKFIEGATGSAPAALVQRIHAQTGGNPFFATEAVRLLLATREEGPGGPSVPQGVREVVARRIAALSDGTQALLRVASVLGREFEVASVQRAREPALRSRSSVLSGLDEALAARVVERCGRDGSYRFVHDLVRETIYDALPIHLRAGLHERVGKMIEAAHRADPGPHLAALAHHFERAAVGSDPGRAILYAARAGERAASMLGYEEAALHYERALDLEARRPDRPRQSRSATGSPALGELLLQLGENRWKSGDFQRARGAFRRAVAVARASDDAALLARAALGFGGGFRGFDVHTVDPDLLALLEEAFARLPVRPTALRGRVMGRLAIALYDVPGSLERRIELSAAAVDVAEQTRDRAALAAALYARHWAIWGPDTLDDRIAAASAMEGLAAATGDQECALHAHRFLAVDCLERGERAAMDRHIASCREIAEALRQPYYRWFGTQILAMRTLLAGRLDESEHLLEEAHAIGSRTGARNVEAGYHALRFWIRREQGRASELEPMLRAFVERVPAAGAWRSALALLYVELGKADAARPHVDLLARDDFSALPRNAFWLSSLIMVADACAGLRDAARAHVLDALLRPYAGRVAELAVGGGCVGSVDRALGRLACVVGEPARAEHHFAAALRIERGLDAPLLAARTERARAEGRAAPAAHP